MKTIILCFALFVLFPISALTEYEYGEEKTFWKYDLTNMPPKDVEDNAYCLAVGERSYIFVSTSQWSVTFEEDDADTIKKYLEDQTFISNDKGMIETVVDNFGDIPDELDGDPRVIFYYSELGSFRGSVFNGYFSAFNQLTDQEAQTMGRRSNECEMLYMTCNPIPPTEKNNLSVLAHELQHLIHYSIDPREEQWVNEGCSEYAMVLVGLADAITEFPTDPDNSLLNWNKQYADLVKVMLFFTYLNEKYGDEGFMKTLVADQAVGVAGIENTLEFFGHDVDFKQIIGDWAVANYVDDEEFEGGKYNYEALDLPAFKIEKAFTSFPVIQSKTLYGCAANYYKMPTNFDKLGLEFTFQNLGTWDIKMIAYEGNNPVEIISMSEDNKLSFIQPTDYELSKLVMVVTSTETDTLKRDYSFYANNTVVGVEDDISLSGNYYIKASPNPFNMQASVSYHLDIPGNVTLKLYDYLGNDIATLVDGYKEAGTHSCYITNNKYNLNPGMYFINMTVNGFTKRIKLMKN